MDPANEDVRDELTAETSEEFAAAAAAPRIRFAAMGLLARREHSRAELQRKLARRFGEQALDEIDGVIDQLGAEGLQSDARFAEHFVASRIRRGQGPVRIEGELRQRGVSQALIEQALAAAETDWLALAQTALEKKYGAPSDEFKAKARQMRFLQYRGFLPEHIHSIWKG